MAPAYRLVRTKGAPHLCGGGISAWRPDAITVVAGIEAMLRRDGIRSRLQGDFNEIACERRNDRKNHHYDHGKRQQEHIA